MARVVLRRSGRGFLDARGFDLASSLAYTSLLTFVPLFASVTVLTSTLFGVTGIGLYRLIHTFVPGASREVLAEFQTLIDRARTLSVWAAFLFLLASLRMFFVIEGATNEIWGTTRTRTALLRLGVAMGVVFLGPVAVGVLTSFLLESGATFTEFRLQGLLFICCILSLCYKAVPGAYVRWGPSVAAGALAGFGVNLLKVLFTRGFAALTGLNQLYGPISAAVIFVFALGPLWTLLLFGVSVAHAIQYRYELLFHDEPEREQEGPGPMDQAVRLLLPLARSWLAGSQSIVLPALAKAHECSEEETRARLGKLAAAGLVTIFPDGSCELARAPEQISLYAIERAAGITSARLLPRTTDPTAGTLRRLYKRADRRERHVLEGISLRDLSSTYRPAEPPK